MFKVVDILRKLMLFGMLLMVACQDSTETSLSGTASLRFILRSVESTLQSRGIEDDLDSDGSITDEEMYVNGSKMYRLALFLVEGGSVVSYIALEADDPRFSNDNTEATVSFTNLDYSKTYKLYAVANYGNYEELTGNLAVVSEDNITGGLRVNASESNLCSHLSAYPLTLAKDINLTPGENIINGELIRTYARLRLNVRNQSSHSDLCITDLSFNPKFTQQSADIFVEGGTANVSPVVTSSDAIIPFAPDYLIPKMGSDNQVNEATIFDTYLLESTGGNYNYTLSLQYPGITSEVYEVSGSSISNYNDIEDGELYVMYNANSSRYLYINGNNVGAGSSYMTNGELNHNYVWRFNKISANRFTIESMGSTGYFMQSSQMSSSRVPLTVTPGNSDYFTATTTSGYLRLQGTRSSYFLAVNGSSVYGNNSTSSNNRRRYNFYLYKVEKKSVTTSVDYEETIPINIVDKVTGEASPITAIRRNDFIDILVNVTYNEKSGDVEFEVTNWEDVEGEVTFD